MKKFVKIISVLLISSLWCGGVYAENLSNLERGEAVMLSPVLSIPEQSLANAFAFQAVPVHQGNLSAEVKRLAALFTDRKLNQKQWSDELKNSEIDKYKVPKNSKVHFLQMMFQRKEVTMFRRSYMAKHAYLRRPGRTRYLSVEDCYNCIAVAIYSHDARAGLMLHLTLLESGNNTIAQAIDDFCARYKVHPATLEASIIGGKIPESQDIICKALDIFYNRNIKIKHLDVMKDISSNSQQFSLKEGESLAKRNISFDLLDGSIREIYGKKAMVYFEYPLLAIDFAYELVQKIKKRFSGNKIISASINIIASPVLVTWHTIAFVFNSYELVNTYRKDLLKNRIFEETARQKESERSNIKQNGRPAVNTLERFSAIRERTLLTNLIKESELSYDSGVRDAVLLDREEIRQQLPKTISEIPHIKRDKLFIPNVALLSEQYLGTTAYCWLAFLPNGHPVALKRYLPENGKKDYLKKIALREFKNGKVLELLGVGPKFYGIFFEHDVPVLVMDIVPGDHKETPGTWQNINGRTIKDLFVAYRRILNAGYSIDYDFQFHVMESGRIGVIDPYWVREIAEHSAVVGSRRSFHHIAFLLISYMNKDNLGQVVAEKNDFESRLEQMRDFLIEWTKQNNGKEDLDDALVVLKALNDAIIVHRKTHPNVESSLFSDIPDEKDVSKDIEFDGLLFSQETVNQLINEFIRLRGMFDQDINNKTAEEHFEKLSSSQYWADNYPGEYSQKQAKAMTKLSTILRHTATKGFLGRYSQGLHYLSSRTQLNIFMLILTNKSNEHDREEILEDKIPLPKKRSPEELQKIVQGIIRRLDFPHPVYVFGGAVEYGVRPDKDIDLAFPVEDAYKIYINYFLEALYAEISPIGQSYVIEKRSDIVGKEMFISESDFFNPFEHPFRKDARRRPVIRITADDVTEIKDMQILKLYVESDSSKFVEKKKAEDSVIKIEQGI